MQGEKRKREDDDGEADRQKGRARHEEDGGVEVEVPADEEVEEFFVMVRRMQVALEYFKKRTGRQITAASWIPLLETEDFGREEGENDKAGLGLDLNSDPVNEIETDNVPNSG